MNLQLLNLLYSGKKPIIKIIQETDEFDEGFIVRALDAEQTGGWTEDNDPNFGLMITCQITPDLVDICKERAEPIWEDDLTYFEVHDPPYTGKIISMDHSPCFEIVEDGLVGSWLKDGGHSLYTIWLENFVYELVNKSNLFA